MSSRTLTTYLAETGLPVDEQTIIDTLEDLRAQGWLAGRTPSPTEAEEAFLDAHGGVRDDREALVKARVSTDLRSVATRGQTLTVGEVAETLGVSASRVRHRVSEGTIYADPPPEQGPARRRIPTWQLHQGHVIPGIIEVVNALPEDFTPSEVRGFVLNAVIDHPTRDQQVPLVEWLLDGGDPQTGVRLAEDQALAV